MDLDAAAATLWPQIQTAWESAVWYRIAILEQTEGRCE
jgi:hypothetical protein